MEGRRNSWCCTDYLTLDNGRMAILLPAFNLPGKSPLCDRRGLEWILRRQVIEPLPNIRDLMMIPIVFLLHFKAWHNNKTFAFIWNFSSHSTRLKKPTNTQLTSDWKLILLNENSLKKKIQAAAHLQPGSSCQTSSSLPCWLAGWPRVGGLPVLFTLITSLPPVLHSLRKRPTELPLTFIKASSRSLNFLIFPFVPWTRFLKTNQSFQIFSPQHEDTTQCALHWTICKKCNFPVLHLVLRNPLEWRRWYFNVAASIGKLPPRVGKAKNYCKDISFGNILEDWICLTNSKQADKEKATQNQTIKYARP